MAVYWFPWTWRLNICCKPPERIKKIQHYEFYVNFEWVNKQILELTFSNKKCIEQLQVITKSKIVPLCPLPSISVLQILFRYQLRVRRSQKQAKFKSKITLVNRYFYSYWKSGCFGKNEASVKYWLLGHTDPYNKKKKRASFSWGTFPFMHPCLTFSLALPSRVLVMREASLLAQGSSLLSEYML